MAQIAYVDWDGLVYYDGKIKKYISDSLEPTLKDGGKKTFKELPYPSYTHLNYIYTVTEDFTADNRFDFFGRYKAGTVLKVTETRPAEYRYTIFSETSAEISTIYHNLDQLENKMSHIDSTKADKVHTHSMSDITDFKEIDLDDYATKLELAEKYATKDDLNTAISHVEKHIPDVTTFVTDDELATLDYASKDFVEKKIAEIENKDITLSNYYTKEEVNGLIPDTSKFLEAIPDEYVTADELAAEGFIKEQDLSSYALKSEIPTDYLKEIPVEYVTEAELESKGYLTEHQDISSKADKATTLSGYGITDAYTRTEIDTKLLEIESGGKIDEETLKGFVSEDEWNERISFYATKEDLEIVQTTAGNNSVLIKDIDSELVDINARIDNINIPTNVSAFTNDAGYLTEHQSLDGYAKTSEIPDVSNFITMSAVEAALGNKANNILFTEDYKVNKPIGNIDSNYVVKDKTIAQLLIDLLGLELVVKYSITFMIDDIICHEARYEEGETIQLPDPPSKDGYTFDGWKVGEYYLTDMSTMPAENLEAHAVFIKNEPEAPVLPENPTLDALAKYIEDTNAPTYSLNTDGTLAKQEFVTKKLTTTTKHTAPSMDPATAETFFYTVTDESGNITEAGYQIYTIYQEEDYMTIALPDYITSFHVEQWDGDISKWTTPTWTLDMTTNHPVEGYTTYSAAASEKMSGISIRVVID